MQIEFEPSIASQLRALAAQCGKSEDFCVQQAVKLYLAELADNAKAAQILAQENRVWTQEEVERDLGLSH